MKLYRILDMSLRKYDAEQEEYKVGSYGSTGGVLNDVEECKNIITREKERQMLYNQGYDIEILIDEDLEFQCKTTDTLGSVTLYSIKAVELYIGI